MAGRAPPFDEPDAQARASSSSGNAADERTHRSRLAGTGVYRTQGDTGSSGRTSAPEAIAPLDLRPNSGAKNAPSSFKPMKT